MLTPGAYRPDGYSCLFFVALVHGGNLGQVPLNIEMCIRMHPQKESLQGRIDIYMFAFNILVHNCSPVTAKGIQ